MVDEIKIEDLEPKDNFTLSDLFRDDEEFIDYGDGITSTTMSEPQGFIEGLGATAVDILRDYRNTGLGFANLIGETLPIGNVFSPNLKDYKYKDPEGEVIRPDGIPYVPEFIEDIINETYAPSEVDEDNPYKNYFTGARAVANSLPIVLAAVGSRGGLPYLVNKLPAGLQKLATQAFPYLSGRGKIFPSKKVPGKLNTLNPLNYRLTEPTSLRNAIIAGITKTPIEGIMGVANAAPINTGIQDRDYAVFDEYITPRLEALRNQPTERPPSNRQPGLDNYRGL